METLHQEVTSKVHILKIHIHITYHFTEHSDNTMRLVTVQGL